MIQIGMIGSVVDACNITSYAKRLLDSCVVDACNITSYAKGLLFIMPMSYPVCNIGNVNYIYVAN